MSCKTKVSPETLIKQTFSRTKNVFHKAYTNLKSLVPHKLVKSSPNHILLNGGKIQKLEGYYTSFSGKCKSNPVPTEGLGLGAEKLEKLLEDESNNKNGADYSRLETRTSRKITGSRRIESGYLAAAALSKRMKELEMMDMNDMDHVLDIEEALHYYSRLTCPAYQDIVEKFFMDMYLEFHVPEPEPSSMDFNTSMRKLGSASLHTSMRSLAPIKL